MTPLSRLIAAIAVLWLFMSGSESLAEGNTHPDRLRPILWMGTSDGPPHMIEASNSGLDIDIPRAALARVGYELKLRYMPLARAYKEVQNGRLDMTAPTFVTDTDDGYRSDPYVWYRPTAFSLARNDLDITSLTDLGRYSIMTFQGATGYFGPDFVAASNASPLYREFGDMAPLPLMLAVGRTDIVVLDFYIFQHFNRKLRQTGKTLPVTAHDIFPPVPATILFRNPDMRDSFNKGLQAIKDDGSYQQILDLYSR